MLPARVGGTVCAPPSAAIGLQITCCWSAASFLRMSASDAKKAVNPLLIAKRERVSDSGALWACHCQMPLSNACHCRMPATVRCHCRMPATVECLPLSDACHCQMPLSDACHCRMPATVRCHCRMPATVRCHCRIPAAVRVSCEAELPVLIAGSKREGRSRETEAAGS